MSSWSPDKFYDNLSSNAAVTLPLGGVAAVQHSSVTTSPTGRSTLHTNDANTDRVFYTFMRQEKPFFFLKRRKERNLREIHNLYQNKRIATFVSNH